MESNNLKQILIAPYSRLTHETKRESPKNYPHEYWQAIVTSLRYQNIKTIQIGTDGEKSIGSDEFIKDLTAPKIKELLIVSDLFLAVDNFLPHFAYFHEYFKGIVLWGQSDPDIFGYKQFTNLYVDKKYFRPGKEQYRYWEPVLYIKESFSPPDVVLKEIYKILNIS